MKTRDKKFTVLAAAVLAALTGWCELVVDIEGVGAEKFTVSIDVGGQASFAKSLRRNLELSGVFKVQPGGSIAVSGATGAAIRATGRGKSVGFVSTAADERAARTEARLFADKLIETYANQKGFSNRPIAFVQKQDRASELYTCYPDGYDMRRLTSDSKEAVGPRWKDANTLFYTGFLGAGPQIYEVDTRTGAKKLKKEWRFKGLSTGATVAPDARRAAIILSVHGNPELYVIDMATSSWVRLTNTKNASEGQPAWSPDGREIVYVSNESRYPQLYVINVETREKRRLTTKGSQNVDPDWGPNGLITYTTKRGGLSQIAVIDPRQGESSTRLVTQPGAWEHPSWACDGRHVIAARDEALFVVDTLEKGDEPARLFMNPGKWITPSWSR